PPGLEYFIAMARKGRTPFYMINGGPATVDAETTRVSANVKDYYYDVSTEVGGITPTVRAVVDFPSFKFNNDNLLATSANHQVFHGYTYLMVNDKPIYAVYWRLQSVRDKNTGKWGRPEYAEVLTAQVDEKKGVPGPLACPELIIGYRAVQDPNDPKKLTGAP